MKHVRKTEHQSVRWFVNTARCKRSSISFSSSSICLSKARSNSWFTNRGRNVKPCQKPGISIGDIPTREAPSTIVHGELKNTDCMAQKRSAISTISSFAKNQYVFSLKQIKMHLLLEVFFLVQVLDIGWEASLTTNSRQRLSQYRSIFSGDNAFSRRANAVLFTLGGIMPPSRPRNTTCVRAS